MTANEQARIGAILLAAGGSSRLGRPKQLVEFEGEPLIRRAAVALAGSVYFPVIVVLGAESDASRAEIASLPVYHTVNEEWQEGMSSSIRAGLLKMLELAPDIDAVLISLCDQPRVTAEMLTGLALRFRAGDSPIVASAYKGTAGVPALFSRELFTSLLNLKGDKGARHLIRGSETVVTVDLPAAEFDIDTAADLR